MIRKNLIAWGALLGVTLLFTDCRRGEEDPWLSLRSRNQRITGVWQLKEMQFSTYADYYGSYDLTYHDGVMESELQSVPALITLEIKEDGTCGVTYSYDNNSEFYMKTNGNWYWNDSPKNKDGITLRSVHYSHFYPGDEIPSSLVNGYYSVQRLSNTELQLEVSVSDSLSRVITYPDTLLTTYATHTRGSYTFEKIK